MRLIDADNLPYAMKDYFDGKKTIGQIIDDAPTVKMAEDCISRQAVLEYQQYLHGKMSNEENHKLWEFITDLPSVTSQPKRGKWIVIRKEYEFMGGVVNESQGCKCSNCGGIVKFKSDFCPNCGADMRDIRETGITAKEGMEIAKAFHDGIMEGFAEMEQQRRGDA